MTERSRRIARFRNRSQVSAHSRQEHDRFDRVINEQRNERSPYCVACQDGFHTKCNDKLAWVFGDDLAEHEPCPCGCWDPKKLRTSGDAMRDMARRQPDYTAQHMWIQEGLNGHVNVCGEGDIRR